MICVEVYMFDIAFISYDEKEADSHWDILKKKYPYAKRTHGVKGIHQAHIEAAKKAFTPMVWIIDADAVLLDNFNLRYMPAKRDQNAVHVWRSQNPINDLEYGYGGVKLFPRYATVNMDISKPDMTTSISDAFILMNEISNITAFNVSEFATWKSAFRECTKLASKVIDRQKNEETENRLHIWQTVGQDRPYGEYAIRGALEGTAYGRENQNNVEALKKINNFGWLREQYNANI